jgi:hypothetical protein
MKSKMHMIFKVYIIFPTTKRRRVSVTICIKLSCKNKRRKNDKEKKSKRKKKEGNERKEKTKGDLYLNHSEEVFSFFGYLQFSFKSCVYFALFALSLVLSLLEYSCCFIEIINWTGDEQIPTDLPGLNGGQHKIGLLFLPKDLLLQVLPLPAERSHPHHRYPQADPSAHDQEFRD